MRFMKFQEESGLIGNSPAILQIFQTIEQVAPSDISVLIVGESGTGKELVARAIHQNSKRAEKPLIIVNCGAIPEGLIESELFGHEKGAFTGAIGTRKGFFETAHGGTVFLDEIGEMPLSAQVKLLRVLEGHEFTRVGGSTPQKTDVRIIAATNRSLDKEVQEGNFRQDLYFRLRAVTIEIPPLRARREDIPLLAQTFATRFAKANHINFAGFDETAFSALANYNWPGNVRELKNLIESIIVLEKGAKITGDVIRRHLDPFQQQQTRNLPIPLNKPTEQVEREFIYRALIDLKSEIFQLRELILTRLFPPKRLRSWENDYQIVHPNDEVETIDPVSGEEIHVLPSLPDMEKNLIEETLNHFNGNKRKAAASLQISERTLYRKIKEYNLKY
ncbi:sigma-54-dependent Fis family transcriptional regulator [candidate division KSB1 bacterium 4484_87]|nr:MAG: sigma-54-dependent Fis family transcriptional regulator [candidate division KSB1 bacterium 4484_87]